MTVLHPFMKKYSHRVIVQSASQSKAERFINITEWEFLIYILFKVVSSKIGSSHVRLTQQGIFIPHLCQGESSKKRFFPMNY